MPKRHLLMWEPNVSPHKLGLFHALKAHPAVASIRYIADEPLSDERRRQGWDVDKLTEQELTVAPSVDQVLSIVNSSPPEAVHLFSGVHWVPSIVTGLRRVCDTGRIYGIMGEPRVLDDSKAAARIAHSLITEWRLRKTASIILAIGRHGPRWFKIAGYRHHAIFPFAYFLNPPQSSACAKRRDGLFRVGYVGRLESMKGVDLLIKSVAQLDQNIRIVIAGSGTLERDVRAAAAMNEHIEYRGKLPINRVPDLMDELDLLILPSTSESDGWGAVVCEALFRGCAVLVSCKAGASICLEGPDFLGQTLKGKSSAEISNTINKMAHNSIYGFDSRLARAAWANRHVSAHAGANYLISILNHVLSGDPRPAPFFLSASAHFGEQAA